MAGEWRHRTITSSALAAPARVRLLAAKLISYGELLAPAVAVVVLIAWVGAGFGVTAALLRRRDLV